MDPRYFAIAVLACFSTAAMAFDQPEVKYYIQLMSAGKMVECKVGTTSLGEWVSEKLMDGTKIQATASPPDDEGKSAIRVKVVSIRGDTEHEFQHRANLAASTPQFTYSASRTWPMNGVAVVVESAALLATTRPHPSWREFDPRTHPGLQRERSVSDGGCGPRHVALSTPG